MRRLSNQQKKLLDECCRYSIGDVGGKYIRLGGYGTSPIRYNGHTLYKLRDLGLVSYSGYWNATELGRKVNLQ